MSRHKLECGGGHTWDVSRPRLQCAVCGHYLTPWHVWAWDRAKTAWFLWRYQGRQP